MNLQIQQRWIQVERDPGGQSRLIPMGGSLYQELWTWHEKYRRGSRYVLYSIRCLRQKMPFGTRAIHRVVYETAKAHGIPCAHPHLFRHLCAIHMLQNGAPDHIVQQFLGLSRTERIQRYHRADLKQLQQQYEQYYQAKAVQ